MSSNIFKPTKHSRSRPTSSRSVASSLHNQENITPRSNLSVVPKLDFTKLSLNSNENLTLRDLAEISRRPETEALESTKSNQLVAPVIAGVQSMTDRLKPSEQKSIDHILNQRDEINKKIEKKRLEKQRLARLKAIETHQQKKLQKALEESQKQTESHKKPAKKKPSKSSTPAPVNTPHKIENSSTNTSITNVSDETLTEKSDTLDAILKNLQSIEESAKSQIAESEKYTSRSQNLTARSQTLVSARNQGSKLGQSEKLAAAENESLVSNKINSIMSYLEEIESNTEVITPKMYGTDSETRPENGSKTAESTVQEITNSVLSQKLELNEAKEAIKILEKSLNKQKELAIHQLKQTERDLNSRIKVQKDHYEDTITRHLHFIDQLISDKKKLQEKYESLVKSSKENNEGLATALEKQKKQHLASVNLLKENYLKAEKERREKWIVEQTKVIKKSTVNALEPEINKLMASHKQEISRIKTLHEADILEADERASKKYVEQINKLRTDLETERDEAVDRERINAQQRFDKMLEQEELAFHAQKKRLYQEIAEEKERLFQQSNRLKKENEDFKQQLESTSSSAVKVLTNEYEAAKILTEKRHKKEIEDLKNDFKGGILGLEI